MNNTAFAKSHMTDVTATHTSRYSAMILIKAQLGLDFFPWCPGNVNAVLYKNLFPTSFRNILA